VFENILFGIIFGPKRDEGTGDWGKLHYDKHNDLYSVPNVFRVIKLNGPGIWHLLGKGEV
jgi:hypothetical protein